MTRPVIDVQKPECFDNVAPYRFWGDRKPPKNRAEFWRSWAAEEQTTNAETGDVQTQQVATLRMYGPIDSWGGWWGISARDVSEALDAAKGLSVTYPSDYRDCMIRVDGVDAAVRFTGSSLEVVVPPGAAPGELNDAFAVVRNAFQISKVLGGLIG